MIQLLKMAWRDLGRNRRRSFFSALALGIGLALLLLMAATIEGELRDSMNITLKLQSGHLQVRALDYDETKSSLAWADLVENPTQMANQIASLEPVSLATPRLFASGIVLRGEHSIGVRIVGIDPASAAYDIFRSGMLQGDYLQADDRSGVLIGRPLAEQYGLNAGDSINLMVNTANGDVDEQPFTIRGIYTTKTPAYDRNTLLMPLAKAQAITKTENHASILFVLLKDREQSEAVAASLSSAQYDIQTWREMNALLLETQQLADGYMVLIYIIVLGITATVIVNTLVMAVFERTREIGILAAIGMRGWRIMFMFFAESALLAVGGILIGWVLGALLVGYASYYGFYIGDFGASGIMLGDTIYAYLTVEDTVSLTLTAFIITLLAALYPALLAARMQPVEALRGSSG